MVGDFQLGYILLHQIYIFYWNQWWMLLFPPTMVVLPKIIPWINFPHTFFSKLLWYFYILTVCHIFTSYFLVDYISNFLLHIFFSSHVYHVSYIGLRLKYFLSTSIIQYVELYLPQIISILSNFSPNYRFFSQKYISLLLHW